MTLEDIKALEQEIITPSIAAQVLNCDPHWIRIMARANPEQLGFPVIVCRNRTKIPRRAFIRFMEGNGY